LTERPVPSLRWAAHGDVVIAKRRDGAEGFSLMANEVPGLCFFLGAMPQGQDAETAAPNHSHEFMAAPNHSHEFMIDESPR
jgi:amidohydrolase